jgi:nitrogen regulatory protein P-II 1
MKKIEAIIRPFKLEEVWDALCEIGVGSMTVSEVLGHGRGVGGSTVARARGRGFAEDFLPQVQIEVVVSDAIAAAAVAAVVHGARTGKTGDGKVFVEPIEQAIRIRTEEIGEQAI